VGVPWSTTVALLFNAEEKRTRDEGLQCILPQEEWDEFAAGRTFGWRSRWW